jgi:hypothetical protein
MSDVYVAAQHGMSCRDVGGEHQDASALEQSCQPFSNDVVERDAENEWHTGFSRRIFSIMLHGRATA